jgi:hypothetical protein
VLVSGALLASGLVAVAAPPAQAAYAVPPTTRGLTSAIEAPEPYIGQSTCNPVAKPGVVAFRNLLLRTYPDTGSLGITRDCGIGGQSEHKEGRGFDWRVSYANGRQRAEANALLTWLTRTDAYGNRAAMARRLGIMYMIWNHKIWKVYDSRGWQPYHGASPHTDHVHFSFGWNGAKKVTSYWDRTVAPIDFGPRPPVHVTPVRAVANLALVRTYGGTTLALPARGTAVRLVQKALRQKVDGDYGAGTAAAVARFQVDQRLAPTQRFGPAEWRALFPPPVVPFGALDATRSALGNLLVTGWAVDADTTGPIDVRATLDGAAVGTTSAALWRADVAAAFPELGPTHGFAFVVPTVDGPHQLCLTAVNAPGSPGTDAALGCATVQLTHGPSGALETLRPSLGVVHVTGWALDPDAVDPVTTALTVDGAASPVVPTAATRTDLGAAWPGMGDGHGVTADLELSEGTHTVCLSAANLPGTPGADARLGCRTVVVPHSPAGALELAQRAPGGVSVRGWALDPDVVAPVTVDVLSDGAVVTTLTADAPRPDLAPAWPDQGASHGLATVVDLPVGTHQVCLRPHNAAGTPGADLTLPCRSVTVAHEPVGVLTALRTVPGGGAVLVSGDAYDPDTALPSTVVPLVDGVARLPLVAALPSTTADGRWPGYGALHGFAGRLTLPRGTHRVCLSLLNAVGTPGVDRGLGCRTLVVSDPIGSARITAVYPRRVIVRGWALDPDVARGTTVAVVVDGRTRYVGPALGWTTATPAAFPGYGGRHGYVASTPVTRGTHRVCVWARNATGTPGSSRSLGCSTLRFA